MYFFRINNNRLSSAGEVDLIGFDKNNPMYIPDEYLDGGEFVVMRTCHGIGDWCIISALPRLLKSKYPNCKVYVPSSKMLKDVFGNMMQNWGYGVYDATKVTEDIFKNNPYVDGFVDYVEGEIFHDHYRIFDSENSKIPLVTQMLKFWQFEDDELSDTTPDIYFSKEEDEFGKKLIGNLKNYGYISVSSTYGSTADTQLLVDKVKEYGDIHWFYYGETPIESTNLNFIKNYTSVKELNLNIRQQMYLKTNAVVNVGNESGMTLWGAKYSPTYALSHKTYGKIHGKELDGKPRKDPFKTGNFVELINYI